MQASYSISMNRTQLIKLYSYLKNRQDALDQDLYAIFNNIEKYVYQIYTIEEVENFGAE